MLVTRVVKDCLHIQRVVHERMVIGQKEEYLYQHLTTLRQGYWKFGGINLFPILLNGWFYCRLLQIKWWDICPCIHKCGSWIVPRVCTFCIYTNYIYTVYNSIQFVLTWFVLFHTLVMYELYIFELYRNKSWQKWTVCCGCVVSLWRHSPSKHVNHPIRSKVGFQHNIQVGFSLPVFTQHM